MGTNGKLGQVETIMIDGPYLNSLFMVVTYKDHIVHEFMKTTMSSELFSVVDYIFMGIYTSLQNRLSTFAYYKM